MRTSKEQNNLRCNFIIMFQADIETLIVNARPYPNSQYPDKTKEFITTVVRPWLGYKDATYWKDICCSLNRLYKIMVERKIISPLNKKQMEQSDVVKNDVSEHIGPNDAHIDIDGLGCPTLTAEQWAYLTSELFVISSKLQLPIRVRRFKVKDNGSVLIRPKEKPLN